MGLAHTARIRCTLRPALFHGGYRYLARRHFVRGISRVSTDEQHVALPQLYGAPAYARPPAAVSTTERPFDPDELPIEALRTDEEREFTATLPARAYAPGGVTLGQQTQTRDRRRRLTIPVVQPASHHRSLPRRELTIRLARRTGVASTDGGVAQSVRAAGLYPAGSRFESWLPYHSHAGVVAVRRRRPTASRIRASRWLRLPALRLRWRGSAANQAGIWSARDDRAERRARDGRDRS